MRTKFPRGCRPKKQKLFVGRGGFPKYYLEEKQKPLNDEEFDALELDMMHALNLWNLCGERLLGIIYEEAKVKKIGINELTRAINRAASRTTWMKDSYIRDMFMSKEHDLMIKMVAVKSIR